MIYNYPDLHPDELLYSGHARYAHSVRYPNLKNMIDELFGSRHIIASIAFASHLQYFVTQQPQPDRFTTDSLITEHTLLPFYAPFLPQDRVEQLTRDMCGTNGPGVYMRVGLMASTIPSPQYLQYCPECSKEDKRHFGEMYWHRQHQIPGVLVCHIHNVWLEHSSVQIHNRKTRHQFVAAEEALRLIHSSRPMEAPSHLFDTLLFIAKGAAWLLQQKEFSPGLESLRTAYTRALASRDLATYSERIRMTELQEAFVAYYPDNVLSYLHCTLDRQSPDNWLARLVRKPDGSQHPLQHLLLMRFLGCTPETFFSKNSDQPIFGTGPWPCLNSVSDHYRQPQIEECKIVYSQYISGKPIGTFSCSCGFVYSRTGPDVSVEDQFRFDKIKTFGQVWDAKLQILWNDESISLRGIARQLRVDSLTIKRHATRIGLSFPRAGGKQPRLRESLQLRLYTLQAPETTKVEKYRTAWLATLQEVPSVGVKKLRSKVPGIYTWLYRNDRVWLKAHTPVSAKKAGSQFHRVDWEERDMQLAEKVRFAVKKLRNLPVRPVHITKSAIGREIGQLALLQQHLDKLPRAAEALELAVETREAFAVRRITWLVEVSQQKGNCLERWQLIREAGVGRLTMSPQVNDAIDYAMYILQ